MERFYRFADITFCVSGSPDQLYREDGVLGEFRTAGPYFDHRIELEIVGTLPPPEGKCVFWDARKRIYADTNTQLCCVGDVLHSADEAYMHIRRHENCTQVRVLRQAVPDRIMPRLVLNAMEAEHHIVRHGGFVLHASFIRWQDRAVLFTAPSGTGKSTQAELWRCLRGAELINGDRVALMQDSTGVKACGIPFCGTSGVCRNTELNLAAIVYLSQAPRSEISNLTGLRAFQRVWEGCSVNVWNREDMTRCSQTVMDVVQRVPVYHLACTPDESAVAALEKVLTEGR